MKREVYENRRQRVTALMQESPERFDMDTPASKRTRCGTAHCIAGWTLVAAGARFLYDEHDAASAYFLDGGLHSFAEYLPGASGARWLADAARYLGLKYDEAYHLFHNYDIRTPHEAGRLLLAAGYAE